MSLRHKIGVVLLVLIGLLIVRIALIGLGVGLQPVTQLGLYTVYFATENKDYLMPEYRSGEGSVIQRLEALVEGPRSKQLVSVLPQGTRVISYQVQNRIVYVNLNRDFVVNHPGGSLGELVTIYAVVNTLTEMPSIDRVQILVEGRVIPTLAGHVEIVRPLQRDRSLIGSSRL